MQSVSEQILFDLQKGKLSHAILIDGGSETERTETAASAAKALVCMAETVPCGQCTHCVKAQANAHPDILVFSGGTTPGSFKVDDVREIRRLASVLPNEAERKVFILHKTESMSPSAQNALLKILEEPPAYVCFILTCDAHDRMLDTIMSRVTLYALGDASVEAESAAVQKARDIARTILLHLADDNEAAVLRQTAVFEKDKELFRLCLSSMAALGADALLQKTTDRGDEKAAEIGSRLSSEKLLSVVTVCTDCLQYMNGNLNANLLLTYFCAQLNA